MKIDLSQYKLVRPESIEHIDGINKFYDIEVEEDHTFHIVGNNDLILSHNCDGNSISGLLINFFHKYWPDMFDRRMIYKVETPIVASTPKTKGEKKKLFYTQTEYNEWEKTVNMKNWEIAYKKGLGALVDDEYRDIITKPRLTLITRDEAAKVSLNNWFGKSPEARKEELLK
jgi:DNA topoisomerase-2